MRTSKSLSPVGGVSGKSEICGTPSMIVRNTRVSLKIGVSSLMFLPSCARADSRENFVIGFCGNVIPPPSKIESCFVETKNVLLDHNAENCVGARWTFDAALFHFVLFFHAEFSAIRQPFHPASHFAEQF